MRTEVEKKKKERKGFSFGNFVTIENGITSLFGLAVCVGGVIGISDFILNTPLLLQTHFPVFAGNTALAHEVSGVAAAAVGSIVWRMAEVFGAEPYPTPKPPRRR